MLKDNIRSQEDWEHMKYKLDETMEEVARYRADEAAAEADLRISQAAVGAVPGRGAL